MRYQNTQDLYDTHIIFEQVAYLTPGFQEQEHVQCFRQATPLRESCVTIREGPEKNGKGANLALYYDKAACLTQA